MDVGSCRGDFAKPLVPPPTGAFSCWAEWPLVGSVDSLAPAAKLVVNCAPSNVEPTETGPLPGAMFGSLDSSTSEVGNSPSVDC